MFGSPMTLCSEWFSSMMTYAWSIVALVLLAVELCACAAPPAPVAISPTAAAVTPMATGATHRRVPPSSFIDLSPSCPESLILPTMPQSRGGEEGADGGRETGPGRFDVDLPVQGPRPLGQDRRQVLVVQVDH